MVEGTLWESVRFLGGHEGMFEALEMQGVLWHKRVPNFLIWHKRVPKIFYQSRYDVIRFLPLGTI
jgi:hypothetical protein